MTSRERQLSFVQKQRLEQGSHFARECSGAHGYRGSDYRLMPDQAALNLSADIRDGAVGYFREKGITWHRHANHGLSSQVCCLNFLMPLRDKPAPLARVIGRALGITAPEMLPVEGDSYVAFEWIGERDYLNEAGKTGSRTRGANATSADAAVRFRAEGQIETALIEWKYTESYGAPISPSGNPTRIERYKDLAFAPSGPIRNDLGLKLEDFFWEPFYQLLRQQMLALEMQKAKEGGAQRVRVLHLSPAANIPLKKVTAPALRRFGDDAFSAFKVVLVHPENFVSRSIEDVFGPLLADETNPMPSGWGDYLRSRYSFLGAQK
jgi:hypothetical protein